MESQKDADSIAHAVGFLKTHVTKTLGSSNHDYEITLRGEGKKSYVNVKPLNSRGLSTLKLLLDVKKPASMQMYVDNNSQSVKVYTTRQTLNDILGIEVPSHSPLKDKELVYNEIVAGNDLRSRLKAYGIMKRCIILEIDEIKHPGIAILRTKAGEHEYVASKIAEYNLSGICLSPPGKSVKFDLRKFAGFPSNLVYGEETRRGRKTNPNSPPRQPREFRIPKQKQKIDESDVSRLLLLINGLIGQNYEKLAEDMITAIAVREWAITIQDGAETRLIAANDIAHILADSFRKMKT